MILLDTHVLIWLDQGSERLGREAREQIEEQFSHSEITVSSISFWEIAMLVQKKRLSIAMDLNSWRRSLLRSGVNEIEVSGEIGIRSAQLENFHGDPADRIITATALHLGAKLITADQKILNYGIELERLNAAR